MHAYELYRYKGQLCVLALLTCAVWFGIRFEEIFIGGQPLGNWLEFRGEYSIVGINNEKGSIDLRAERQNQE